MSKETVQTPVAAPVLQAGLEFAKLASLVTKRATDELSVHRGTKEAASKIAPSALAEMKAVGMLPTEANVKSAELMLASHPETINLLRLATQKIATLTEALAKTNSKEARTLGGPENPQASTAPSGETPARGANIVGGPRNSIKSAAHEASERVLRGEQELV
jgi:hypothetical protein